MSAESPISGPETKAMVRLSDQLTDSLRRLLRSSPWDGLGPIELARALGVDKTLTSRLLTALKARDPLVGLSSLPGTTPLRQFTKAARKRGADAQAAMETERGLDDFDLELQRTFGTRTRLDAVIADALPETRRRHMEGARQAVYRGMALIKGVSIDLVSITWLIRPGRGDRVDLVVLAAFVGVRRLRPTARVRLASSHGQSRPQAALLREFCRPEDLSIGVSRDDYFTYYEISTGLLRRDAAADIYLTETLPGVAGRERPAEQGRVFALGDSVTYAYKKLSLSVLLDQDLWPGCGFSLRAYDTSVRGHMKLPDPTRELDRMPVDGDVRTGKVTEEGLRANGVPGYAEMLRRIAPGWEPERFRSFTAELIYPTYSTEYFLVNEPG